MKNLNQLLGITAVGAAIVKAQLVKRFVSDLASVITLAIATGFVAGMLLISGFYIAYQGLTHYGLEPLPAQIITVGLGIITLFVLIAVTSSRVRRLNNIPGQIIHAEFPLAGRINAVADSFLNGLMES